MTKAHGVYAFLLCFIILLPSFVHSQEEVFLSIHQLTAESGLSSQEYNYYVYKDSEGLIWISSTYGLNRFDGIHFKHYLPTSDSNSIYDANIHSHFFETQNGNLWFSTHNAINRYDRGMDHFETIQLINEGNIVKGSHKVLYINERENLLFARVNQELFCSDLKGNAKSVGHFSMNYRTELVKNSEKKFILINPRSESKSIISISLENSEWVAVNLENCIWPNHSICADDEGKYWYGTDDGLVLDSLGIRKSYAFERDKAFDQKFQFILKYDKNTLLLCNQDNQLFLFDKIEKRFSHKILPLVKDRISPFNHIRNLYVDDDGYIWISCQNEGIYYGRIDRLAQSKLFLTESPVRGLIESPAGSIWCISDQEISMVNPISNQILHKMDRGNSAWVDQLVNYCFLSSKNDIWIAGTAGLTKINLNQAADNQITTHPQQFGAFTFVRETNNYGILAASQSNGIFQVHSDRSSFAFEQIAEIDNNAEYTWIFEDSNGFLFLCQNQKQIDLYAPAKNRKKQLLSIPFGGMLNGIVQDTTNNSFWLASNEGLFLLNTNYEDFTLEVIDQFMELSIQAMEMDDYGNLWMSTNNGVIAFDPRTNRSKKYSRGHSLQGNHFNYWVSCHATDNHILFGGPNGFNIFFPSKNLETTFSGTPCISEILVNDQTAKLVCQNNGVQNHTLIESLELPFDHNTLSFRFGSKQYDDHSNIQFKYQLHGVDITPVSTTSHNPFTRYANLSPGKYEFELAVSSDLGIWSDQTRRLQLYIKPPWFQTLWFRCLLVLLAFSFLYFIYRFRLNQVRRKELFLRKEAEYKQLVAETETAVLRLQMKPHFIFNALQSIDQYIWQSKQETASDFLQRFAGLMRKILNLADRSMITVHEEFELLEDYLETESHRLSNPLKWEFTIDSEIDQDETLLPTMILQPFVENAIWHGIQPSNRPGKIQINLRRKNSNLLISILDNGVGRGHHRGTDSNRQNRSKAIEITSKRLRLLNNQSTNPIEIEDLYDEDRQAAGTRVLLELPFIQ